MNFCENLEENAERNPDSGGLAYEVSDGSKDCIIDLIFKLGICKNGAERWICG